MDAFGGPEGKRERVWKRRGLGGAEPGRRDFTGRCCLLLEERLSWGEGGAGVRISVEGQCTWLASGPRLRAGGGT